MEHKIKSFAQKLTTVVNIRPESFKGHKDRLIVTQEEYLKDIYAPREALNTLKKELQKQGDTKILCVAGPRGSGKSTLALKFEQDIQQQKDIRFLLYNVNRVQDDQDVQSELNLVIKGFLLNYFSFENESYTDNPRTKFFEFFLDRKIDINIRPRDQFDYKFENEISECIAQKREYDKEHGIASSLSEWVRATIDENKKVKKIFQKIWNKIEMIHLCYAIKHNEVNNIIVWIDNIDSFEDVQQKLLLRSIELIQNKVDNLITFVVSVREENVHIIDHNSDLPTYYTRELINVSFGDDRPLGSIYKAKFIPYLKPPEIQSIVEKRIDLARKKLFEHDDIDLDDKEFSQITSLSNLILRIFQDNRVAFLANHSLRTLLPYYASFFDYLANEKLDEYNRPYIMQYTSDKSILRTKLIEWMTRESRFCGLDCFNIVEYTREHDSDSENMGCYIEYLVLTTILNILRRRNPQGNSFSERHLPTIENVCTMLYEIGLKEPDIKRSILNLSSGIEGGGNFINIRSRTRIERIDQLDKHLRIRLTYKATTALSIVYSSFTYNYLSYFTNRTIDIDKLPEQCIELLSFLCEFGNKHLLSLVNIRDNYLSTGFPKNWLGYYRNHFSMPTYYYRTPLRIHSKELHVDIKGLLYFESLCLSISTYFHSRNKDASRCLMLLYEWYQICLAKISDSGDEYDKSWFSIEFYPEQKKFVISKEINMFDFSEELQKYIMNE